VKDDVIDGNIKKNNAHKMVIDGNIKKNNAHKMVKENKLKQHEDKYYHIPKGRLRYIPITLILLVITIGSFYVLIDSWKFLGLGDLECLEDSCDYHLYQLMILPIIIWIYLTISLTICSFVSIFKNLKSYGEKGLIFGLIGGLIFGLIGLIVGLIYGLIYGLIVGLIYGLIYGLIGGLIFGLIFVFIGLIFGLIVGLIEEFSE